VPPKSWATARRQFEGQRAKEQQPFSVLGGGAQTLAQILAQNPSTEPYH